MRKRTDHSFLKLALAGVAVAAIASTPLLGSAAGLANTPFGIKAVNTDGSGKFSVKPFGKSEATQPSPGGEATTPPVTPEPTPSPTEPVRAPDATPNLVKLTIDTSLSSCTATTSGFQLAVASVNSNDTTKTPLPVDAGIDWGDSSSKNRLTTGINSHVYKAGKYNLTIDGTLGGFDRTPSGSVNCISRVDHLGENTGIVTLKEFLYGATGLVYAAAPPTSLDNGRSMLNGASIFTGDGVETWVLPKLTDSSGMFASTPKFDGDLSNFNPKSVKDATGMFGAAKIFTGKGLDRWNTSSFTNTGRMFASTNVFNKDITGWDMSHVTSFDSMFNTAKAFNQPIGKWDVSSGKSFHSMFADTVVFNQPLDSWNMSSATSTIQMFMGTIAFNQDLNSWNVSKVTDMTNMFRSAKAFDGKIDKWDTSSVTDMFYMFWGTAAFKQNISAWNVTKVTNWQGFYTASLLKSSYPSYVPSKFRNTTGYNG